MISWTWFHRLASPPSFFRLADRLAPWLGWLSLLMIAVAWFGGLVIAPPDYNQGELVRIIYVHVPAAALSLSLYAGMTVAAVVALVWRMKLAEAAIISIAPVGASFTALALVTGMLWGKPAWGVYWAWDARLTFELVMLFFYLGVIGLWQAFEDPRTAARACALLAIVGSVNVPLVKYSVDKWNAVHQGSTILKLGTPNITADMAWPLVLGLLGTYVFAGYVILRRLQNELLLRETGTAWVRELMGKARV